MINVIVLMGKIDLNKFIEMGDEFPEYCNATAEKIRKEISADESSLDDFIRNDIITCIITQVQVIGHAVKANAQLAICKYFLDIHEMQTVLIDLNYGDITLETAKEKINKIFFG